MTSDVQKILAMLRSEASSRQCAAALVLGELAPRDSHVISALGRALAAGDIPLKQHILAAFARIKARGALPFLLPMLRDGDGLRERTLDVIAAFGPGVSRDFRTMLARASVEERRSIYAALARVRGRDGLNLLLQGLFEEDPTVVEEVCQSFRREVQDLDEVAREELRLRVEAFLDSPRAKRSRTATAGAIRLLGDLKLASAQTTLLAHSGPQNHPATRYEALRALRRLTLPGAASPELAGELLSYMEDRDFTGIVTPAIEILTPLILPEEFIDRLLELAKNGWTPVRRFALRKLREFDTPRVAKALMQYLDQEEPAVRDLAAESLCYLHTARPMLLERFLKEENLDTAWVLSRTLRPHGLKLKKDQIKRIGERLAELIDAGSSMRDPCLQLLRYIAPEFTVEQLLARVSKLKNEGRYADALQAMGLFSDAERRSSEVRFVLAVLHLKLSAKTMDARARAEDESLEIFSSLIAEDKFPLFDRVIAETYLGPEYVYYLATNFADRLDDEGAFGSELLKHFTMQYPKDKNVKSALARLSPAHIRAG